MNRAFMIADCCLSVKKPAIAFGLPPAANSLLFPSASYQWLPPGGQLTDLVFSKLAHAGTFPLWTLPRASSTSSSSAQNGSRPGTAEGSRQQHESARSFQKWCRSLSSLAHGRRPLQRAVCLEKLLDKSGGARYTKHVVSYN